MHRPDLVTPWPDGPARRGAIRGHFQAATPAMNLYRMECSNCGHQALIGPLPFRGDTRGTVCVDKKTHRAHTAHPTLVVAIWVVWGEAVLALEPSTAHTPPQARALRGGSQRQCLSDSVPHLSDLFKLYRVSEEMCMPLDDLSCIFFGPTQIGPSGS